MDLPFHAYPDFHGRARPDTLFAIEGERQVTFGEGLALANRLANRILQAGLAKGDRLGMLCKNSIDMALIYWAASKTGVVPVPLNYRLAPPEWAYILGDARADLVFCDSEFLAGIDSVRGELSGIETYVSIGDGGRPGWQALTAWARDAAPDDPGVAIGAGDIFYQMYTSGTTGHPKGVLQTHGGVLDNVLQAARTIGVTLEPGERILVVAPLYHAAAAVSCIKTMIEGGTMVIHRDFHPLAVVDSLERDEIVATSLVPAMIQMCLTHVTDIGHRNFDKLRGITYGASPIAEDVLRRAIDAFDCDFVQGYGMTETSAVACLLSARDHERALAGEAHLLRSCGKPVVGTGLRIVDRDGHDLPHGEVGEIVVRGPQIMQGYWNLPEATNAALRDGWLHTGDAGYRDAEGFVFIQDRVKDMVISGGENIYPAEVENALFAHPDIADAAVIGVPDDTWGEAVLAFVVLRKGADMSEGQVIEHARTLLGGYKVPRHVRFIDDIPRNPTGKALKRELRKPFWEGHDRQVG